MNAHPETAPWLHTLWPTAERIDTPISTVFLVGDDAYKLKKAVRLPFLDFSTLAQRQHFLAEELRLNQRTAAGLYLSLLPVTGSPDAPVLNGPGEPFEWVLHMRRFPPGSLLSERAQQDQLTPAQVDDLAQQVAAFHQGQAPLPACAYSHPDLSHWASASIEEIASHPALTPALAAHLPTWRTWLHGPCAAQTGWRAQRAAQGWVRDVHGDLHLGNLVWWQGHAVAFDALEFDPALRQIDTMNDAAFAFMDLHAQASPALAWRFISAYAEQMDDHAGLQGLPVYASYRALVRAKVALFNGDLARSAHYADWATQLMAPPPPPSIWLMMGLSGSGKSTLALALLQALTAQGRPAVRLRADVERKRLFGLQPTDRPGATETPGTPGISAADLYSPQASRRTYDRLLALAQTVTAAGCAVVLDAASLRHAERQRLRDWADQQGLPFTLVECVAAPASLAQRLQERGHANLDASDADTAVLEKQRGWAEPVPADWADIHRVVHNSGTLDHLQALADALVAG